jgi:hypothetical protein
MAALTTGRNRDLCSVAVNSIHRKTLNAFHALAQNLKLAASSRNGIEVTFATFLGSLPIERADPKSLILF